MMEERTYRQANIQSSLKPEKWRWEKEWTIALIFLLPVLAFIGVFAFYPTFYAVYLSFYNSKFLVFDRTFVGLKNYAEVLGSSVFWLPLWKTAVFTFWSVVYQFGLGLLLALSLKKTFRINGFLRSLIVIPWILSPIVVAVIFQLFYISDRTGLLNYMLMSVGVISEPIPWLGVENAMNMVIVANVWFGMPFSMIMLLAGLQSIQNDVYEASMIDGANKLLQLWYITLPLLKPTILVTLVWITTSTFNEFDLVYALTAGGPLESTNLLGIQMYNTAFKIGQFEKGSTIAVLMFLINLFMSVVYYRMLRRKEG